MGWELEWIREPEIGDKKYVENGAIKEGGRYFNYRYLQCSFEATLLYVSDDTIWDYELRHFTGFCNDMWV